MCGALKRKNPWAAAQYNFKKVPHGSELQIKLRSKITSYPDRLRSSLKFTLKLIMNNFIAFLKSAKVSASTNSIRLVMGNTSGDMDSIVGALGLAYYLTLKTKE